MSRSSNRAEHDRRALVRLLTALFIVQASIWLPGALGRLAVPLPGPLAAGRWYALVYDPSGLVLETQRFAADGSNWNEPELAPVKRLFGGPWFMCGFGEPWAGQQAAVAVEGYGLPVTRV